MKRMTLMTLIVLFAAALGFAGTGADCIGSTEQSASTTKQKIERLEKQAAEQDRLAEYYLVNRHPHEQKHPQAVGEAHARYWAERLRRKAAKLQVQSEQAASLCGSVAKS